MKASIDDLRARYRRAKAALNAVKPVLGVLAILAIYLFAVWIEPCEHSSGRSCTTEEQYR